MPTEMPPTRPTRRLLPLAVADGVAGRSGMGEGVGFGAARRIALTTFRAWSS
jgi:hypothetical protein